MLFQVHRAASELHPKKIQINSEVQILVVFVTAEFLCENDFHLLLCNEVSEKYTFKVRQIRKDSCVMSKKW